MTDMDAKINGSICVRKLHPKVQNSFGIDSHFFSKNDWEKRSSSFKRPSDGQISSEKPHLNGKNPALHDDAKYPDRGDKGIVTPISFQAEFHEQS